MHFSQEPEPEDANSQPPLVNMEPLTGFPPPVNPTADIGDAIAAEKAIKAVARYRGSPNVIKSSLMSYQEALKFGLEPIAVADDNELANTLVRVVEMTGVFKTKISPFRQQEVTDTLIRTKAYVILRAADNLRLCIRLFTECVDRLIKRLNLCWNLDFVATCKPKGSVNSLQCSNSLFLSYNSANFNF